MASTKLPVLIVGAGPSGLTMALCLAKHGVPVRIIDSSHEYHRGSRGSGLMPRSLEMFKMLGILKQVEEKRGVIDPPARFYKYPETSDVALTDANPLMPPIDPTPDRPLSSMWFVPQFRLEAVFRKELEKYGVTVELDHELLNFEKTSSIVRARIRVKSNGEESLEEINASFLVGADGAKGLVRKLLEIDFLGKTIDADGMLVANATVNGLSTEFAHVWKLPNGLFFSLRPIDHTTKVFAMAVLGPGALLQDQDNPGAIRNLFEKHVGRPDVTLGEFHWYSFFKPNMRMVSKFSEGRVFVVGDAAHIHSPHGGQGLNTSVQDSFNLAWKMALVFHEHSPIELLDAYNEERLPVVTEMLRKVVGLYNAFSEDAHKALTSAAHPKELFQLDINYRWSPILIEERNPQSASMEELKAHAYVGWGSSLCAGDRAPDAPELVIKGVRESTTLFEIFNLIMHTILVFGDFLPFQNLGAIINSQSHPGAMQIFSVSRDSNATAPPDVATIYDKGGHIHSAYKVDSDSAVLIIVRPDGFIGCIATSEVGVEKYLSLIFSKRG
ncbi:FAD binding domain-containing protein [Collybia nuda]|uniref:FAD binding domain-containing protein n=1 Tax=Collybia nuda TaxID=64659 RepID=A0A9P5YFV3_9AGAR|nr:FAD binding domain-containing protein [Collybia nuda]